MAIQNLPNIQPRGVGRPDYSAANPTNIAQAGKGYTSSDVAELAVRMGSSDVYDRRGNVIFIDDFSNGVDNYVYTLGAGAGSAREWRANIYERSGFCLRLYGGLGTGSGFSRQWNTNNPGKVGVEISGAAPAAGAPATLAVTNYFFDGANFHLMGLVYDPYADELSIWDPAGALQVIETGLAVLGAADSFSTIKLVTDFENDQYVRLLINQREINLSQYKGLAAPMVSGVYAAFNFDLASRPAINDYMSIGTVIITQNESINV
jgi:hypothetical protein